MKKEQKPALQQNDVSSSALGKRVQFSAARIRKGNPVRGLVTSEDDEWIEVELEHKIEGLATVWEAGERKTFRKTLIGGGIHPL